MISNILSTARAAIITIVDDPAHAPVYGLNIKRRVDSLLNEMADLGRYLERTTLEDSCCTDLKNLYKPVSETGAMAHHETASTVVIVKDASMTDPTPILSEAEIIGGVLALSAILDDGTPLPEGWRFSELRAEDTTGEAMARNAYLHHDNQIPVVENSSYVCFEKDDAVVMLQSSDGKVRPYFSNMDDDAILSFAEMWHEMSIEDDAPVLPDLWSRLREFHGIEDDVEDGQ